MLPNLLSKQVIILITLWCSSVYSEQWESGLRQRYDGYGEDWIFMPDGNGQPQVAVLKVQETRGGILDGSEIVYVIYTRYSIISCTTLNIKLTTCAALFCTIIIVVYSIKLPVYLFLKIQSERRHASYSK